MTIFSFSNAQSSNVTLLGSWDDNSLTTTGGIQYNDIWGYAVGGKEFAIVGARQKILFLDVTNPTQITQVAAISPGGNSTWRDMKTYRTYAYGVTESNTGSEGLLTFDLSQIDDNLSPVVTLVNQQNALFTTAHNIFIDTEEGILYVIGPNVGNVDLILYDLKPDPSNPIFIKSVDLLNSSLIHDAYIKNNIAYVSQGNPGLFVYDMSNITTPPNSNGTYTELGRLDIYSFQGYNHSNWVRGDYIVFADENHGKPLKMVDASVIDEMEVIDLFQSNQLNVPNPTSPSGSIPHNPFIIGDLCVVSYYHDGVVFYDISDPTNVTEVGYYDTETGNTNYASYQGCWGTYPFLPSGRILASDVLNGLHVLELSSTLSSLALLPVTWKNIAAKAVKTQVEVSWSTSEELNNKGFWVQRKDNKGAFENLDFVLPSKSKSYVYWDENPTINKNYYRIAQEDFDGTISYSSIVSATIKASRAEWTISPNPVSLGASIILQSTIAESIIIGLFDTQGRLVQSYTRTEPSLNHSLRLPDLAAGVYFLSNLEQDDNEVRVKVVVK